MKSSILVLVIAFFSTLPLFAQSTLNDLEYEAEVTHLKDNQRPAPTAESSEENPLIKAAELRQTTAFNVRQLIMQNLEYPEIARDYGIEGTVVLEVTIGDSGKIQGFNVLKSPYAKFDEAINRSVQSVKNQKVIEQSPEEAIVVRVPINFRLQ